MRILLIEDDPNKAAQIHDLVGEVVPSSEVVLVRSSAEALEMVLRGGWQLVILDMTLPPFEPDIHEDNREETYAGRTFLHQMRIRRLEIPVVLVTGFDEFDDGGQRTTLSQLAAELSREFGSFYKGAIHYRGSEARWRVELSRVLQEVGSE